jgi:hypothetical protein
VSNLSLSSPGDYVLAQRWVFGKTGGLLDQELPSALDERGAGQGRVAVRHPHAFNAMASRPQVSSTTPVRSGDV